VFDAAGGLAVVSVGQLESAVRDLPERPIALTLFRATRRTVMTDGEPDGQLQEADDLSLLDRPPRPGSPTAPGLCLLGQRLAAGLRAAQLRPVDVAYFMPRQWPPGDACRLAADREPPAPRRGRPSSPACAATPVAVELRLFNPLTVPATAGIVRLDDALWREEHPFRAERVDLEGRSLAPLDMVDDGAWALPLRPKEIATVHLT
jgi:hypothetical protein